MPNRRIDDLAEALIKGEKQNGNHRIVCTPGPFYPDMERCAPCDRSLGCLALGRVLFDKAQPLTAKRPCIADGPTIHFYYHGTLCLSCASHIVTDHGMWGHSVTTSRSIRWYLEALFSQGYIDSRTRVDELCHHFKKRPAEEASHWIPTT